MKNAQLRGPTGGQMETNNKSRTSLRICTSLFDGPHILEEECPMDGTDDDFVVKPRPTPIYANKQHEEYWAFLRTVPEAPHDSIAPPSRCPSLMSRGTLSSRNSSTRSARSSVWDPNDDGNFDGVTYLSDVDSLRKESAIRTRSVQLTDSPVPVCPIRTCDRHTVGFLRDADKSRHMLKHFTGVLKCNFCPENTVSFSQSSDRVSLLLTHMVKAHGVSAQREAKYESVRSSRSLHVRTETPVAACSVCTEPFGAQSFYEHLPGCILRVVARNESAYIETEDEGIKKDMVVEDDEELEEEIVFREVSFREVDEMPSSSEPSENDTAERPQHSIEITEPADSDVAELTASSRCLSLTSSKGVESEEEETDWTEEQTSRESSLGASQVPRRLSPAKRRVVETIMQEFQRLFCQTLRAHTAGGTGSSSSSSNGSSWSSNASTYSSASFVSRKRSLSGGDGSPPNDEDDSNKRRRESKAGGKQAVPELRFACPYYKRNPGRHQTFTSCRDPGFITVARLKEHLYRRHLLPPQCHRCCTTFTNDTLLRDHQRDTNICSIREQIPLEGFDKEQERRLKSKKRSQTYQAEEEKWKGVYRILFPDDAELDMPTPYIEYQPCTGQAAEPSGVVRFQEFSRLELPRLVRRTLEVVVEQEAQPLEEKLKERLVDIVKECQNQLVALFQANAGPSGAGEVDGQFPVADLGMGSGTRESSTVVDVSTNSVFEGFESLPVRTLVSNPGQPDFVAPLHTANPTVPSDSGYNSIWSDPSTLEPQTEAYNPDNSFDLSSYLSIFDNQHTAESAFTTLPNGDTSTWSFIEPFPAMDSAGGGLGTVSELEAGWGL